MRTNTCIVKKVQCSILILENQETPVEVITVGLQELEYQHKSFKLLQFLLTLGHKVEGTVAVREGGNMVL